MTHEQLLRRITTDPEVCHGRPCVKGHRIWVSLVLDLLADGLTIEQLIAHYPGLVKDDVRACLAYASEMTRERLVAPGEPGDSHGHGQPT
ncbi:MAG: DUF433 domain-containing protein [Vicinamibacterales bacterium]